MNLQYIKLLMHKHSISLLHLPLCLDPHRTFTFLGQITALDRGLKKTMVSIKTVDLSRENDNEDFFTLVMYGQIKSIGDKILEVGDLLYCTGQLNCPLSASTPELEIKHFTAYDGVRTLLETTRVVSVPLENIINPDSAY